MLLANMANESGSYDQDLEDRIVKIIAKIREKRCRPCYQNIYTQLNQGGKEININDLKVFIGNMVENGLLINRGCLEKESFYLNNGERNNVQDESEAESEVQNNINSPPIENYINSPSIENYINEKFHDTLINLINTEVKKAVKLELQTLTNDDKIECRNNMEVTNDHMEVTDDHLDNNRLKDELFTLRSKIKYKDNIIKKLNNELKEIKQKQSKNKLNINNNDVSKKTHNVVGNKSEYRNDKQDTVNGNKITRIRDTGFNNEKFNSDRELNNSQRSIDAEFYNNKNEV